MNAHLDGLSRSERRNKHFQLFWENCGSFGKILIAVICLAALKFFFRFETHRLSPDIGSVDGDSDRPGQVVGFHYEIKSWWGHRSKNFDRIRFKKDVGPQYLDPSSNKWEDIPPEAWGDYSASEAEADYYAERDYYR